MNLNLNRFLAIYGTFILMPETLMGRLLLLLFLNVIRGPRQAVGQTAWHGARIHLITNKNLVYVLLAVIPRIEMIYLTCIADIPSCTIVSTP
jgi:hypothetical protein